jgi:hypothetical protein
MSYEPDIAVYKKMQQLKDLGVSYEKVHQGFKVENIIMVAKKRSKWKKLGCLDWYPYYGLKNLIKALKEDRLDEYAAEQESKYNAKYEVPLNSWKDLEKRKTLRAIYEQPLEPKGLFK